jgi:P4 family phage/plasmid primase-like protien
MFSQSATQTFRYLVSPDLADAYTDFVLSRQAMRCTRATLEFYRHTASKFLEWAETQGVSQPKQITAYLVRQYLANLADKGKADSTLHDHARAIRTLLRFWFSEGYQDKLVKFDMPRVAKKRLPVLSADELRKAIEACEKKRDKALLLFLADSGLRRSEVCNLNWQDVDMQTGLVSVKQGKGRKDRSAVISPTTRRALLQYRRTNDGANIQDQLKKARGTSNSLKMAERYRAVLDAVKTEGMTIRKNNLDGHPHLLNTKNGVIDFSSNGKLIPHEKSKDFYITKMANTGHGPKAKCPKWEKFIQFLFPDPEMQDYIERMCGYLLTGYVSEQVLFLLLGAGNNGKSMFAMVLQTILDEYAAAVPFDTLMAQSYDNQITPHLHRLPGVRLAVISETKIGKAWDAGLVKAATGGDTMTSNPKHKEAYQFKATHKFVVLSNHKPRVNDNSLGFWRRMHVIPFEKAIEKPEPFENVLQRFMDEAPGILNWCIEGELRRQEHRLTDNLPKAIAEAVNEYRSEEDVFSEVLELRYIFDMQGNVKAEDVVQYIRKEFKKRGHFEPSAKTVTAKLQERGVTRGGQGKLFYYGIRELLIEERDARGLPVDDQERFADEFGPAVRAARAEKAEAEKE